MGRCRAVAGLRIALIVLGARLLIGTVQRAIGALTIRIASRFDDPRPSSAPETLGRVSRYVAAVVVSLVTGMLVSGECGV